LWAHRTSKHGATKVTPFELVYAQEDFLPVEINLQTHRVSKKDTLLLDDYTEMMMEQVDGVPKSQFRVLEEIEKEKMKVIRAYNRKVKKKLFQVGQLVWKTILPLGSPDSKFGKWSPTWE
jgi:hypothetical protein